MLINVIHRIFYVIHRLFNVIHMISKVIDIACQRDSQDFTRFSM